MAPDSTTSPSSAVGAHFFNTWRSSRPWRETLFGFFVSGGFRAKGTKDAKVLEHGEGFARNLEFR